MTCDKCEAGFHDPEVNVYGVTVCACVLCGAVLDAPDTMNVVES